MEAVGGVRGLLAVDDLGHLPGHAREARGVALIGASKDNPTKLLVESARKLYGTSNEELMDNAKQFAYYPVAVLKDSRNRSAARAFVSFLEGPQASAEFRRLGFTTVTQ